MPDLPQRRHVPISAVDFLTSQFEPGGGLRRIGDVFVAEGAWPVASFGQRRLRGGWWKLECEGDVDLSAVELRLSSPADPLIMVRPGIDTYLFLSGNQSFDIRIQVAAWPGRVQFRKLELRRLSGGESARLAVEGLRRVLGRQRRWEIVWGILKRLRARQSVGVRTRESESLQPASLVHHSSNVESNKPALAGWRSVRENDLTVVVRAADELHSRALEIASGVFDRSPEVEAVYADVDAGCRIQPLPGWDLELARYCEYVSGPVFFRGVRPGNENPWPQIKAIADRSNGAAIERIALPLACRRDALPTLERLPAPLLLRRPRVSIIIPTKYKIAMLEKCLAGLASTTRSFPDLEVVIVDNGCKDKRFPAVLQNAAASLNVVHVKDLGSFNFPRLVNNGFSKSSGEIVVLLNDDAEPTEAGWLDRMVDSALSPDVGAVGARLLYPDGAIQHAGVMMWMGGAAGHLWKGVSAADAARNPAIIYPGTRLAVTGACVCVRRELYDKVGGLDEAFAVAFNDIDFCLRLRMEGARTVYRGDAVLLHHESQSRGADDLSVKSRRRLAEETRIFFERWRDRIGDDPFGSPAFDLSVQSGAVHQALRSSF